jgi:hypothetical protein
MEFFPGLTGNLPEHPVNPCESEEIHLLQESSNPLYWANHVST